MCSALPVMPHHYLQHRQRQAQVQALRRPHRESGREWQCDLLCGLSLLVRSGLIVQVAGWLGIDDTVMIAILSCVLATLLVVRVGFGQQRQQRVRN